ncbi:multidrug transporter AcrB [Yersinia ruckeri]|uniref:Cobalt-zinc-cadmium resistance protein CzcA Cation efflux system protein CusA n=1 Tax=Yersinia ruckeri TaxID=29486 RepID=A0A0A8VD95_YERRU|nr:efflux RND transporter permease subunit [Yersinia ruckeri]EEP97802.1 Transporter, AcrB/AcrD/AcrF family [Yersinia ruckeri ATCC 29473]KGA49508.1 acrB/AcrD/AcrF family protein [Yersinia ruckeri ATCC 29473]MCK8595286.1 efflux RND transporter permease subunit [Yersinia ruckeri]MCK8598385.1 efflux RND transporter permease subunit [Yersinia ruckeri]MCW6610962.1 efflux RND transporter permease subunit [Yersinia ruckeri]
MKLTDNFINNNTRIWLTILLLGIGGLIAYLNIGRLEDPAFTIKTAVVVTRYEGASAQQVEEEVTLPLENAIQELSYVDDVRSISSAGLSQITINVGSQYGPNELPQIWDELRRKISDNSARLPPGAGTPLVNDDFGDVYGFFFSLSGEGYTNQDLRNFAEQLRRELVLVNGVGKVGIAGILPEEIQVDISRAQMTAAGIIPQHLADLLSRQNVVSNSGQLLVGSESIRLHPTGEFNNVQELGNLLISEPGSPKSVYLRDIATVRQGVSHSPTNIYRSNGQPALGVGISFAPNVNVVTVGEAVKARLAQLEPDRPSGMHISIFYDQSHEVEGAVNGFILNFLLALLIVIVTLLIFMGARSGIVIAISLALNVLGTLLIMWLFNIELQRISLGALIIALSMLVDNAIVVVEGVLVGRQRGENILSAISNVVKRSMLPLLGATIIAILAFAPIGLSNDATGEYCRSLFEVLMISLMLSWFTALTLTPVFAKWAFQNQKIPPVDENQPVKQPYDGWLFRNYRRVLNQLLQHRSITLVILSGLLVASIYGFSGVRQSFFPASNTPIFFVDVWLPYGTDIGYTESVTAEIEKHIKQQKGVTDTVGTIGQGAMRFMLTYNAERQYANYAQIMVRTDRLDRIPGLIDEIEQFIQDEYPQVNVRLKRIMFGPSNNSSIEARFNGPDPDVLRSLANEAEKLIVADPLADGARHDWQDRSKMIRPQFSDYLGRELGVDKREVDNTLRMSFGGLPVGLYRDGTRLMPIVLRTPDAERLNAERLNDVMVWSQARQAFIPIDNVVTSFETEWEDPLIMRLDRKRTLTVQTDPTSLGGETSAELLQRIKPSIEAIKLPQGYQLEWGGDYESTKEAQQGIFTSLPVAFIIMFVVTVLMFSSVRNALAIWLTVPLALIGVTVGFLLTGIPFGFMALLGLLSLSGMLIRNGIVLVEEISLQRQEKPLREAIIEASTARLRPIMLTAFTTVLGLAPLLSDAFFQSMAVVIMFGLGFATVLTLLVLPVIYSCMNPEPKPQPVNE